MAVDDGDLAAAVRADWRAEEEQWSRAALERWEHGRGLADVARDCMHRGDVVSFAFATVTWSGTLVAVGEDVARVDTGARWVDLRLARDAPFVLRARAGEGAPGTSSPNTFTARLRELDGAAVGVGTASTAVEGLLRVGRDQLRLTGPDGASAYVPTGSVWWVRPLDD